MPKQQREDKLESSRIEERKLHDKREEQTVQLDEDEGRTNKIEKKKKGQKSSSAG